MIDLASNFNYEGPPDGTADFIREHADELIREYIDPTDQSQRDATARYLGVPEDNVAIGQGATEILFTLPRILDQPRAVMFHPSYTGFRIANERAQVPVRELSLKAKESFKPDLNKLDAILSRERAAVYLCNPNNPTGNLHDGQDIAVLAEKYPDSDFVVDETYLHFREEFYDESLSAHATEAENLHVVHSFSKFFSVPGIRAGALVSTPKTLERFRAHRPPFNSTLIANLVLPWLLDQEDFITGSRANMQDRRHNAFARLTTEFNGQIYFTYPHSNFMLAYPLASREDHPHIARALAQQGIMVRGGELWGAEIETSFRFNIQSQEHEDLLSEALHSLT